MIKQVSALLNVLVNMHLELFTSIVLGIDRKARLQQSGEVAITALEFVAVRLS